MCRIAGSYETLGMALELPSNVVHRIKKRVQEASRERRSLVTESLLWRQVQKRAFVGLICMCSCGPALEVSIEKWRSLPRFDPLLRSRRRKESPALSGDVRDSMSVADNIDR